MGMIVQQKFYILIFTIIFCATNLSTAATSDKAETNSNSVCNGTITECFGNELEMLMDSDTSRRFLQQGGKDPFIDFTNNNIKTPGAKCDRQKYADCIPDPNGNLRATSCNKYDRCRPNLD